MNAHECPHICDECAKTLPYNKEPVSLMEKKQKQYFYKAYSAFKYEQPVVDLILSLKYSDNGEAAEALAVFMKEALQNTAIQDAVLIPVPLHRRRYKKRGYNQAALLAQEIARLTGYNINEKIISRIKETKVQKEMDAKERAKNLRGVFEVIDKEAIKEKDIILIDDVFTSGSTVNECARVLRKAGARQVEVLTAARV